MVVQRGVLGMLGVLALVCACARNPKPAKASPANATTYLEVQNTETEQFTVYVSDGASTLRMGNALPLRTTRLVVPRSMIFPAVSLRFIASPVNGGAGITEEIAVSPGDVVRIRIGP